MERELIGEGNTVAWRDLLIIVAFLVSLTLPLTAAAGEEGVIIAYGDSLTEGCGNMYSSCGTEPNPETAVFGRYDYEDRLQSLLEQHNYEYTVHNFGFGGEQTFDALYDKPSRFEAALNNPCNAAAEYILILQGTNDLLQHRNIKDIKFNLGIMIDKSVSRGLVPLLATIPPDLTPGHEYKEITALNVLIRELVEEKQAAGLEVSLVELYEAVAPYWEYYTNPPSCYAVFNPDDQTHPNAEGYHAMGEVWFDRLREQLPRKVITPWLMLLLQHN